MNKEYVDVMLKYNDRQKKINELTSKIEELLQENACLIKCN